MKICKHKWEARTPFVIKKGDKEFPRMSYVCRRCNVAIHKPIYSADFLKEMEGNDEGQN